MHFGKVIQMILLDEKENNTAKETKEYTAKG
jgi:hypothetical protein